MNLLPFQARAAEALAGRFHDFYSDEEAPLETRSVRVPLILGLKCITGGGKTLVLAEAIERIRERLPLEPIVLWVSAGKVVVEQTLTNLEPGGKYNSFIAGFRVKPLLECTDEDIRENEPLMLLATVGTFNVKEGKNRRVYSTALDDADEVLWERLKKRLDENQDKRPLLIVYDEGHNLSEQQSELLFGLGPDGLISATATPRLSPKVVKALQRLEDHGWTRDRTTVAIPPKEVVDSGLVKTAIEVGGYQTPMEEAVSQLLADYHDAHSKFDQLGIDVMPKAIYVCDTNLADGGMGKVRDDAHQPYKLRKAPPILIWRYLTEDCGIDPSSIAIYSDLKVEKGFPMPEEMNLFKGGDKDYQMFMSGNYRHVIFNLTLQEGWDDPSVYFAYIDKSMGSKVQIEQLVGRVLRQPGAVHYPDAALNTAHFYVRVDARSTFQEVLGQVRIGLGEASDELRLTSYESRDQKAKTNLLPKKALKVPSVNIDASEAFSAVDRVLDEVNDYRDDLTNTRGAGARAKILHHVGGGGSREWDWKETDSANRVMARALFVREIQGRYARVNNLARVEDAKFDARVEVNSRAATHLREKAEQAVRAFLDHSRLHQTNMVPYEVGSIAVDPAKAEKFQHSLHESYSGLNKLELAFAKALDSTKLQWARNPVRSGFGIPLLQEGSTQNFYPDFLIWDKSNIFAVDPTGGHILDDKMKRKLLAVQPDKRGPRLHIRILAEGKLNDEFLKSGKGGYTVFIMRDGKAHALHADTIEEAAGLSVKVF